MYNIPNEITGCGQTEQAQVEQILKALSISQNYGTTAQSSLTGGSAMQVENLDSVLKLVTASLDDIKLWKDIIKVPIRQTHWSFNVQNSYGQELSPFFSMGSNPAQTDAGYNRAVGLIKYLGVRAQINHDLTMIDAAHGPQVAREAKNKAIELLIKNERVMFESDSSINALESDGIKSQIVAKETNSIYQSIMFNGYETSTNNSVVRDFRKDADSGYELDEDSAEDLTLVAINNHGRPNKMYMDTKQHSNFSKQFYTRIRTVSGSVESAGKYVPDFKGSLQFDFRPSLFNRPRQVPLGTAISASALPSVATLTSPVNAASQFATADAGTYSYRVSSVYADGETLAAAEINGAVSAGDEVKIEITYAGSPLYFNIFRAPKGTTTGHLFIGRIAPAGSGVAHSVDLNATIPGTSDLFLLWNDRDTINFRQLGSMMKYNLAITDTSIRWNQLLYGAPSVERPRQNVMAVNVGFEKRP